MEPINIILISTLSIIAVLCLFGNLLVIISICTQKFLRTLPNMYICSLACTDLLMGAFVIPLSLTQFALKRWIFSEHLCRFWTVSLVTTCVASIFHLCAIALDRYLTISHGVAYIQQRTGKRTMLYIVGIWVAALTVGSSPLFGWANYTAIAHGRCVLPFDPGYIIYVDVFGLILPIVAMLILYVRLFIKLKALLEAKRNRNQNLGLNMEVLSSSSTSNTNTNTTNTATANKIHLSKERKAATVLGAILSGFLIGWTPFIVTSLLFLLPVGYQPPLMAFQLTGWLGYCSSAFNPFIYTYFSPDFRKGFRNVLKSLTRTA